jgi:hypothetical protein
VTPRWWGDGPGVGRWSTERLRAETEQKRERREWFALWASFAGGLLALGLLALLGVK